MSNRFSSVEEIVKFGFCMGCGLCAAPSLTQGKIEMSVDDLRRPRPKLNQPLSEHEERSRYDNFSCQNNLFTKKK